MTDHADEGFSVRAAALLRAAANDLKRDDASAARDLGLSLEHYLQLLSGAASVDWELLVRAAQVWPLNERDLLPVHNDVPWGVRIHTIEESEASARVIDRRGAPYYEYRDTAMSRVASYRPEWISMLRGRR